MGPRSPIIINFNENNLVNRKTVFISVISAWNVTMVKNMGVVNGVVEQCGSGWGFQRDSNEEGDESRTLFILYPSGSDGQIESTHCCLESMY